MARYARIGLLAILAVGWAWSQTPGRHTEDKVKAAVVVQLARFVEWPPLPGSPEFERCLEAGMDDYLVKPFHVDELKAVLRRAVAGDYRPDFSTPLQ